MQEKIKREYKFGCLCGKAVSLCDWTPPVKNKKQNPEKKIAEREGGGDEGNKHRNEESWEQMDDMKRKTEADGGMRGLFQSLQHKSTLETRPG